MERDGSWEGSGHFCKMWEFKIWSPGLSYIESTYYPAVIIAHSLPNTSGARLSGFCSCLTVKTFSHVVSWSREYVFEDLGILSHCSAEPFYREKFVNVTAMRRRSHQIGYIMAAAECLCTAPWGSNMTGRVKSLSRFTLTQEVWYMPVTQYLSDGSRL